MTRLFLNSAEVHFHDWSVWSGNEDELMLTVTYSSGKKFTRPYSEWEIEPLTERKGDLLFDRQAGKVTRIEHALEAGEKYLLVKYPSNEKVFVMKSGQMEIVQSTGMTEGAIFRYFRETAQERLENTKKETDRVIAQNVVSQFNKVLPYEGTALHAYLTKELAACEMPEKLIYPFGINETQMKAVQNAFVSQISMIEGPPGTGKTQTILNIIANIIISGKTCAVVSNNNSAVENVYEKLEKKNLGFLAAHLGRNDKKEQFFETLNYKKPEAPREEVKLEEIGALFHRLEKYLTSSNRKAKVAAELREIEVEKDYLDKWLAEHPEIKADYVGKYKLDGVKTVELMAYVACLKDKALTWKDKWELLVHYRIFRSGFLDQISDRESFIFSLQYTYYQKLWKEKQKEKEELEKLLKTVDFTGDQKKLSEKSMDFLYQYIARNMPDTTPDFTAQNYRKNFGEFRKYFPVIGSSSHSLLGSIADGYLLDYVIIDEASQQDLVPGILCLGCARNVIVVGDRKQLSHIPTLTKLSAPHLLYDCVSYSLLDSVSEIFGERIPRTLLKEHYRCHPKIIQFCNQQFYEGELIPMREDSGESALSLVMTAAGNHMRNYKNQREIESVLEAAESCGFLGESVSGEKRSIGFIAPYNRQVHLAEEMMASDIVKNTIHKFQGRECDEIIFSTVLDKKTFSQRQIDFVDNAELVNVAVSRAKDKFILVTGQDVFAKNNKHIAALIRYIEYYAEEEQIRNSPVISAFDLLYAEFDRSLDKLAARLRPEDSRFKSEQIVAALLREILEEKEWKLLSFHKQIYVKQLVSDKALSFTDREIAYMNHRASCDFVLYYRVGKKPCAVIEVDGGYHEKPEQIERDQVKNSILEKAELPLLRLKTTDSNIKEKIVEFLKRSICGNEKEEGEMCS